MNPPLRHKKSYNREMRSKATDDVLSLDSDSDFETGHMESLDLSDNEHLMVIAIDFGTTYSGVAWATLYDFQRKSINLVTEWPDSLQEEGKVTTEMFYEYGNKFWGYGIPKDADPISWFKLLLLKDEDTPEDIRSSEFFLRAKKKVREEGKTAQDLVIDCLKLLWNHTLEMTLKARGEHVEQRAVSKRNCSGWRIRHKPRSISALESRYKHQNLKVIQSDDTNPNTSPRTAICRGAVFKGFIDGPRGAAHSTLSIGSTIARQILGVTMSVEFEEGVHKQKDKYRDRVTGVWMARNQMQWYLYKGQDVSKVDPIRYGFYESFDDGNSIKGTITDIIYQCDNENPPHQLDDTVTGICNVSWSTKGINYNGLKSQFGQSGAYKDLAYEIEVRPSGASTDFAIYYQGKKVGSQNSRIVYE
ncbi:hypothetical protein PENSOL_c023G03038 [Penicillium solitum]|uniref:Uncharacterized protein n=1 Tax=Penicillium solitum TaxID=60172 RepID=A0A1V6R061_9EURO|nr:uncharacterized protein PENSOL_c023G03038 [Penicillium solitum]OQD94825.1 hypothetical protein PENSOL_c023G03038 [Penicillium solitum]